MRGTGPLALLMAALAAGCDLSAPAPTGVVVPETVEGKEALPTQLAGAIGDFAVGFGGNDTEPGIILTAGLFSDELVQTIGTSDYVLVDQRRASGFNLVNEAAYRALQRARASAEQVIAAYRQFDATAVGSMYSLSLAGFVYVLLAEDYCGGIPVSTAASDGAIRYGRAETTSEILARSVAAFDAALVAAPAVLSDHPTARDSVTALVNLAHAGRARALLDIGRTTEAGVEAARIPAGFSWIMEHSDASPREQNGVYFNTWQIQFFSAADSEGVNGIAFLGLGDRRARADTLAPGQYAPHEYDNAAAPIVLAGTTEARLIEAEALLKTGNATGSLALLNSLRASIDLPPLPDAGTSGGRVTQLFRERAFWLWLTGHRLGDLRRLVRQYARSGDDVYPIGPYLPLHGTYGRELALPVVEVNNPAFDPAACDPARP
jgi:hypothetical protein